MEILDAPRTVERSTTSDLRCRRPCIGYNSVTCWLAAGCATRYSDADLGTVTDTAGASVPGAHQAGRYELPLLKTRRLPGDRVCEREPS